MRLLLKITFPIFAWILVLIGTLSNQGALDCQNFQCWDGIVAGQTSYDEAVYLLNYHHDDLAINRLSYGIGWYQFDAISQFNGFISVDENDVVSDINISYIINSPSVGEMINQLGTPSAIYVATERPCGFAYLLYEERGMMVWLGSQSGSLQVDPAYPIHGLQFIPISFAQRYRTPHATRLQWQGYTDYCELLRTDLLSAE